jgi:selenocysteine lyase/cysteine desulfurase
MDTWRRGTLHAPDFDDDVNRSRAAWARMSGVDPALVAGGSTVSQFVGLVATALPAGSRVLTAEGDFTSILFPFAQYGSIEVTSVPLAEIAETPGEWDLIAVSSVQSSNGLIADLDGLLAIRERTGAKLLVDTTQSCGWLPIDASRFDFVVCSAYKWLLCPRGVAFMATKEEHLDSLQPAAAGWYAGDDPWTSIYGLPLRLAPDARRLNLSPAWFSWVGATASLELLAGLDHEEIRAHDVGLADAFLDRMGLPSQASAIVTVDSPGAAEKLAAAGVRTSIRAGRVRASFHLYNTMDDVELAANALATA